MHKFKFGRANAPSVSDPIRDLFGSLSLSELQRLLTPLQEDLIFALEPHLPADAVERLGNTPSSGMMKELLSTIRRYKDNRELVADIRGVVLQSESVEPYLTPEARREQASRSRLRPANVPVDPPRRPVSVGPPAVPATQTPTSNLSVSNPTPLLARPASVGPPALPVGAASPRLPLPDEVPTPAVAPPAYSPRTTAPATSLASMPIFIRIVSIVRLSELGWPQITSADFKRELETIKEDGKITVIVFSNEATYPDRTLVRFTYVDLNRTDMSEICNRYNINPPTIFTICNGSFWRTVGQDIQGVADHIRKGIVDLQSILILARQTYPRPPYAWSVLRAIRFWEAMPTTGDGILAQARNKRDFLPHLLHTLPIIRDDAPVSYRNLSPLVDGVCGNFARIGDTVWTCYTCQPTGQTVVDYCPRCWDLLDHVGHRVERRLAMKVDVYCDCGTMTNGKLNGVRCQAHRQAIVRADAAAQGSNTSVDVQQLAVALALLDALSGRNV
ncbi:hypothetical protein BKA62DRAFT_670168 [Auriculariales sp. MPI-PUGE-AT-0066]|nr:hypothetical protein BKA62DRAFT_670168 [Auriculariales sp. MPI-PUGE-AT-0066]